jgi:O-antigen/teichoic acid export membrane protein
MKKAFKDVTSQIIGNVGTVLLSFPLAIFLARILGPTEFGTFNLLQNLAFTALTISSLGITDACLFHVSRANKRNDKILYSGNALFLTTTFALIATIVIFALSDHIGVFYGISGLGFLVRFFSVEILLGGITNIFLSALLGFGLFRSNAVMKLANIAFRIMSVTMALYLGLLGATAGRMFAWVISVGIMIFLFYKLFSFNIERKKVYQLIRYGMPRYVSYLLSIVMKQLPIFLIAIYGVLYVGIFSAANRIVTTISLGTGAVTSVGIQRIAVKFGKGEDPENMIYKVTKYTFYLAAIMAFAVIPFSRQVVNLVYTESYIAATIPVIILSVSTLVQSSISGLNAYLLGIGKPKDVTTILSVIAISTFVGSIFLIPAYKVTGACIAIFISSVLGVFASLIISAKYKVTIPWKPIMRGIIAGSLMSFVLYIIVSLLDTIPAVILSAFAGTAVFFGALYLVGGIEKDDIELMRSLMPKRSS